MTLGFALNDVVPFVERGQQDRVEVDRPQAVFGFLHPDVLVGERIRQVHEALPEAEGSSGSDRTLASNPPRSTAWDRYS